MKLAVWLRAKPKCIKTGFALAALHLLFILWIIIQIGFGDEAQWQFYWLMPGCVDFPVSLVFRYVILPIVPNVNIDFLYILPGVWGQLRYFITPAAFYLSIGTLWYFYLPIIIDRLIKIITTDITGKVLLIMLVILPILSGWLQLTYWFNFDWFTSDIWVNSIICFLWIVLFGWLFVINSRKKPVLWLLCLLPFVFFYAIRDLFIYLKFLEH